MNDAEGQDEERRRLLANVDGTDVEERHLPLLPQSLFKGRFLLPCLLLSSYS